MSKIKSFFKNNIKLFIGIIIGVVVSGFTVYGATIIFDSDEVGFDNTNANLTLNNASVDNVQDAIDAIYTKANSDSFWLKKYKTFVAAPQYYAYGLYKGWCSDTDTNCNAYADFPTTETTPPSVKNVYAAKYTDGQYGVCIKRNGTEHCFRARNYTAELKHVQDVFSDISCDVGSSGVDCGASDFRCIVDSDGHVRCYDRGTSEKCYVGTHGFVFCY